MESPSGLENFGNTCFFNASINLLLSCSSFSEEIVNWKKTVTCGHLNKVLISDDVNRGSDLWNYFKLVVPSLANGRQHDSHEVVMYLFDVIEKETMAKTRSKQRTVSFTGRNYNEILTLSANKYFMDDLDGVPELLRMFNGQYRSIITCSECFREKNQWDIYTNLCIHSGIPSVRLFLEDFCRSDEIEYDCEYCEKRTVTKKKMEIWKLPKVLLFQAVSKNLRQINLTLNLTDKNETRREYYLKSICFHTGSTFQSGHYYSAILKNKEWYIVNDTCVSGPIDPKVAFPSMISNIYLLLYESNV